MFTAAERKRLLEAADNAPVSEFLKGTLTHMANKNNNTKLNISSLGATVGEEGYENDEDVGDAGEDDGPTAWRGYLLLVKQLHVRDDPDTSWRVLLALCGEASFITERSRIFHRLLNAAFVSHVPVIKDGCDAARIEAEERLLAAQLQLIVQLVACSAVFITPSSRLLLQLISAPTETTNDESDLIKNFLQRRLNYAHRCLDHLLSIAPSGRTVLLDMLAEHFPHKRLPVEEQRHYVAQLLRICGYAQPLQGHILQLVVQHCLEMDVEIIIEDSGRVRAASCGSDDEDNQLQFVMDEASMQQAGRRALRDAAGEVPEEVGIMAAKLDELLVLLIEFCDEQLSETTATTTPASSSSSATAANISGTKDRFVQNLLQLFENCMLPTHKSKFVQFVLFHACSRCPFFARRFCDFCLQLSVRRTCSTARDLFGVRVRHGSLLSTSGIQSNKASHVDGAHSVGKNAVMYLASFLARANFLSVDFVQDVIWELLQWALQYVENMRHIRKLEAGSEVALDVDEFGRAVTVVEDRSVFAQHELFFSIVQACCYCYCFFGVPLFEAHAATAGGRQQLRNSWEKIVICGLDPLMYCLPSIAIEFLKLCDCCALLPFDARNRINDSICSVQQQQTVSVADDAATDIESATQGHSVGRRGIWSQREKYGQANTPTTSVAEMRHLLLDHIFPFDPCLLCQLHQRIETSYRSWSSVPGLIENDDASAGEVGNLAEGTPASPASSLAFTDAGTAMSIASTYCGSLGQQPLLLHRHQQQTVRGLDFEGGMDRDFDDDDDHDGVLQHEYVLTAERLQHSDAWNGARRKRRDSIGSAGSW